MNARPTHKAQCGSGHPSSSGARERAPTEPTGKWGASMSRSPQLCTAALVCVCRRGCGAAGAGGAPGVLSAVATAVRACAPWPLRQFLLLGCREPGRGRGAPGRTRLRTQRTAELPHALRAWRGAGCRPRTARQGPWAAPHPPSHPRGPAGLPAAYLLIFCAKARRSAMAAAARGWAASSYYSSSRSSSRSLPRARPSALRTPPRGWAGRWSPERGYRNAPRRRAGKTSLRPRLRHPPPPLAPIPAGGRAGRPQ